MPRKRARHGGGPWGIAAAVGGGGQRLQPYLTLPDGSIGPKPIPYPHTEHHTCGECFGPRSRYTGSYFCGPCDKALFGPTPTADGCSRFLAGEKSRMTARRRRRLSAERQTRGTAP
jgi:hypothetical protein